MTGNKTFFDDIKPYSASCVIYGDGAKGKVEGTGNLICSEHPRIDDVLLVEGLTINLISISQLCNQGLGVNSTKSGCYVFNNEREVILRGDRTENNCYLWIPPDRVLTSIHLMPEVNDTNVVQDVMTSCCDKLSSMNIIKSPTQHRMVRHIELENHSVRGLVGNKDNNLEFGVRKQCADEPIGKSVEVQRSKGEIGIYISRQS